MLNRELIKKYLESVKNTKFKIYDFLTHKYVGYELTGSDILENSTGFDCVSSWDVDNYRVHIYYTIKFKSSEVKKTYFFKLNKIELLNFLYSKINQLL